MIRCNLLIGHTRPVKGSLIEKGFTYTEVPLKNNRYDLEGFKMQ